MTEKKRELIKTIAVIPSNFEYIAKTGIINGTLLVEIERVMEAYAAQQKSEIKMPTKEAIVQYFNNHFNCHADVIIGDYETTETAMTVDAVLKLIEWLRKQIER